MFLSRTITSVMNMVAWTTHSVIYLFIYLFEKRELSTAETRL